MDVGEIGVKTCFLVECRGESTVCMCVYVCGPIVIAAFIQVVKLFGMCRVSTLVIGSGIMRYTGVE